MPVGTGAETLQNIPAAPYVVDPQAFASLTTKNVLTAKTNTTPGQGQFFPSTLLQSGIVSNFVLKFVGTLTVATASITTGSDWPYGLLSGFKLSANGQNDLWSCNGLDLDVLRFLRNPSFADHVDMFTGTVGGGDTVAVGTYNIELTYEVPIAMDMTSLVGSLYAQSASTNLTVYVTQANNSDIISGNPANATVAGTWYLQETIFDIPFAQDGRQILPDLSRLHGFNAVPTGFTNTGDARTPLIRGAGYLERILLSVTKATGSRLSALPNASASNKIDQVRLEYGGNQRPYVYNPASFLLNLNNNHYGAPCPYDRLVLDFARENPTRDTINMAGVTELAVIPVIDSSVSPSTGAAVRIVQETLF